MTKMLVSVRNVAEALMAAEGGADFIDLKEPRDGALGGLPPATIAAVVAALRRQGPHRRSARQHAHDLAHVRLAAARQPGAEPARRRDVHPVIRDRWRRLGLRSQNRCTQGGRANARGQNANALHR